ncbi:MAG: Holliday junction resolvase RuvX [Planctomycetota bacterium]
MSVWIGVDPGAKRIGIARSDGLGMLATPTRIVDRVELLIEYAASFGADLAGVVVGLPRNMDGSFGPMARSAYEFALKLRATLTQSVVLWDERLTTQAALERRRETGRKYRETEDAQAAAILLQSFLDAGRPLREDPAELLRAPTINP